MKKLPIFLAFVLFLFFYQNKFFKSSVNKNMKLYNSLNGKNEFKLLKPKDESANYKNWGKGSEMLASIASYDDEHFLVATYADIALINKKNKTFCVLDHSGDVIDKNVSIVKSNHTYVPTGVAVDKFSNVYVANYLANNIIRGRISKENCKINFDYSYSSINSLGPENISLNESKDIIVSANFDGSNVTAFRISDGKEIWHTSDIPSAHGVAIFENSVFASSLSERKIYKLDLDTGEKLLSRGSIGWDPLKSEFMWPTSLTQFNSKILISDAHTGYIHSINPNNLEPISYFGGNGPHTNLLNMPYSVFSDNKEISILSTFRRQIFTLKNDTGNIKEKYEFEPSNWPKNVSKTNLLTKGWENYIQKDGPVLYINGEEYLNSYNQLHPVKSNNTSFPILESSVF